jgi:4-hydroxybenzoate polyprenyltransferase
MRFVMKQEKTTLLVLAVVSLVLSVFLPPLTFLLVGLSGGKNLIKTANESET